MVSTAEWIWSTYAADNHISDEGLSELLDMICLALPREVRAVTLRAVVGLAKTDGMVEPEEILLRRLCDGLGLDAASFLA